VVAPVDAGKTVGNPSNTPPSARKGFKIPLGVTLPNVQSQRHVLARNLRIVCQKLRTRRSTKAIQHIRACLLRQVPNLECSRASLRSSIGWIGIDFLSRLIQYRVQAPRGGMGTGATVKAADFIGWGSSLVLLATLMRQVHTQWKMKATAGLSKWLFIGQLTASAGFVVYSYMLRNWVYVSSNIALLVTAIVGQALYLHNKRSQTIRP
jgi:uncharacterized protein with PQ loop repeat